MSHKNQKNQHSPDSASPLVQMVLDGLRQDLVARRDDRKLPSERAIGDRFGVSRTIVRRAIDLLNQEGLVLSVSGCRKTVAALPRQLGASGRPGHLGIWLWPYMDDFVVTTIMRGIQRAAMKADVRLVIGTVSGPSWEDVIASERLFIQQLIQDPDALGGIIWLLGGESSLPDLQAARNQGLEFVFVDRLPPTGFEANFVGTDNVASAYQATRHLLELGHRRVPCLTNRDSAHTVEERIQGYRQALEEIGLEPIVEALESESRAPREVLEGMLRGPQPPTAFFCINDSVALSTVSELKQMAISIPDEISIVGFDGLLRWTPDANSLTSAQQDFYRIGETAMQRLLNLAETPHRPLAYRQVLFEAPLRVLSTTAAPKRAPLLGLTGTRSEVNL
ncbi:MAG: substrate-binding domain-containing protein [Fimbriimonas sp.]